MFKARVKNLQINYQHIDSLNDAKAIRLDVIAKRESRQKRGPRAKEKCKNVRSEQDPAKKMRCTDQSHQQKENWKNVVEMKMSYICTDCVEDCL